ncbi:Diaminopimelate decarboxylase [Candidatus Hepatincolaceae symbiont of Richtersius coronifer]
MRYINNTLFLEDISINQLAAEVKTPFYVYSYNKMQSNYLALQQICTPYKIDICYSIKANPGLAIIKTFADLGAGADVVSIGELRRAIKAGIPAEKISFSGVGKSAGEILEAMTYDVTINIESESEFNLIKKFIERSNCKVKLTFRLNPDVQIQNHPKISTGSSSNKFGILQEDIVRLYEKAYKVNNIHCAGITMHIGSQILDYRTFEQAYANLSALIDELGNTNLPVEQISLGGGFGVKYQISDQDFDFVKWQQLLEKYFKKFTGQITIEPGRYLVAEAGLLITQVRHLKNSKDKVFIVVDAAMNDMVRPAMYNAYHTIIPVDKNPKFSIITADIVGPVCESSDTFGFGVEIPEVIYPGLLAITEVGAYGSSMASFYNCRPILKEVMIKNSEYSIIKDEIPHEILDQYEHF